MKPEHYRITWSGTFGAAGTVLEHWSFSLNCAPPTSHPANLNDIATTAKDQWLFWISSHQKADVRLTDVKVAHIGSDGKVIVNVDGSYDQGEWKGDVPGGVAGTTPMPLQASIVVSLRTARSGPTGKGRFFLPWGNWTLGPDRQLVLTDAHDIADAAAGLINAANGWGVGIVAVVSSKGYTSPVNGVKVGRRPDSLRTRARSVLENYYERGLSA